MPSLLANVLCVVPFMGWHRAVTVEYYEDRDSVLIRLVDYGGYVCVSRSELVQIRYVHVRLLNCVSTRSRKLTVFKHRG